MNQPKKLHPALAALIVIVLIGIVASAVIIVNTKEDTAPSNTKNQQATSQSDHDHEKDHTHGATDQATLSESTDTSTYEDGTYSATGSYLSPGGRESIELIVTIKNGIITETSTKSNATDTEAKEYQKLFADHYKELVIGKKIGDITSLSRVAGSSLTSNGFNDALARIKDDARS